MQAMWQLARNVIVRIACGISVAGSAIGICTVVLLFCKVYLEEEFINIHTNVLVAETK